MTTDEAIKLIIGHLNGLFPRICPKCQRCYPSLRDFYLQTQPAGDPVVYDLQAGDLQPAKPLGAVAVSICPCGAAVALTSEGMPLFQYWSLLLWTKDETRRRSISVPALLNYLRVEVRQRVIAEGGPGEAMAPSRSKLKSAKRRSPAATIR